MYCTCTVTVSEETKVGKAQEVGEVGRVIKVKQGKLR